MSNMTIHNNEKAMEAMSENLKNNLENNVLESFVDSNKRKCEPADLVGLSIPRMFTCKNCRKQWFEGFEAPECHAAPSQGHIDTLHQRIKFNADLFEATKVEDTQVEERKYWEMPPRERVETTQDVVQYQEDIKAGVDVHGDTQPTGEWSDEDKAVEQLIMLMTLTHPSKIKESAKWYVKKLLLTQREKVIKEIEEKLPLFIGGVLRDGETQQSRDGYNTALKEVRDILAHLKSNLK